MFVFILISVTPFFSVHNIIGDTTSRFLNKVDCINTLKMWQDCFVFFNLTLMALVSEELTLTFDELTFARRRTTEIEL